MRQNSPLEKFCDFDVMHEQISTRGPSGRGRYEDERVTLLHTRLAIIDLDTRSDQPLASETYILVYNGEIFNFRDIKDELAAKGVLFHTAGDTEVLLKAIETWGIDKALEKVAGMYAFALYDKRDQSMTLVRDRLGIKPLYFVRHEGAICFASWPAALLRGVKKGWALDRSALQDYFMLGAHWGGRFFVEGIEELQPATMMRITPDKCETRRYWSPGISSQKYDAESFEEILSKVVQQHTVADVPMGMLLSGGVDSSALAVGLTDQDIRYFHLQSSEAESAKRVADFTGGSLQVFDVENSDDPENLHTHLSNVSGAAFASGSIPALAAREIASEGYKVFISANGADELFYGYSRTPMPQLPDGSLGYHDKKSALSFSEQVHSIFRSAQNVSVPGTGDSAPNLRQLEFVERLESTVFDQDVPEHIAYRKFELETYVAADLNLTLDHTSMAYGLEARVPFLDHRLVEYALSLSPADCVSIGMGRKAPLKNFLNKNGLPADIWNRPKVGFSISSTQFAKRRRAQVDALHALKRDEYLDFYPRGGAILRDYQYTLSAAQAFDVWRRNWIDTGVVSA